MHRCKCNPRKEYVWTHHELTDALEAHPLGILEVGPKRYELVSIKRFGEAKHDVRFVDVT